MIWQDYAFTTAAILFGYSVLPQVLRNYKCKSCEEITWQFIIFTLIAICISLTACFSLKLYLASSLNVIQFMLWFIIGSQKFYYGGSNDKTKDRN